MTGLAVGAVLGILFGLVLAGLAWRLLMTGLGLGSDFVIRYRGPGRVVVRGRVARSQVGAILEFCSRDLHAEGPFAVRGSWGPNRSLRLRWTGRLTPAQRQRVRNFLLQCLA